PMYSPHPGNFPTPGEWTTPGCHVTLDVCRGFILRARARFFAFPWPVSSARTGRTQRKTSPLPAAVSRGGIEAMQLAQRLVKKGVLTPAALAQVAELHAATPDRPLHLFLVERGFAKAEEVFAALADEFGMELRDLSNV